VIFLDIIQEVKKGNKRAIGKLISKIENESPNVKEILKILGEPSKHAVVVGITGPPGAGKSTLINQLAYRLLDEGKKVGIIAVDPSSPITGGALLGDRIRMIDLNSHENIFIRSMATRGALGGISKAVNDTITLLNYINMDYILVETVGVGQSEVEIRRVADIVILVTVPGLGDDIQSEKAGIIEIADVIVVNKADRDDADNAVRHLVNTLRLNEHNEEYKKVSVINTVAVSGQGIDELIHEIKGDKQVVQEPK